jgi:hypothetical protein
MEEINMITIGQLVVPTQLLLPQEISLTTIRLKFQHPTPLSINLQTLVPGIYLRNYPKGAIISLILVD